MKTKQKLETYIPRKKAEVVSKNSTKSLTLDEIEEKMIQLATTETGDVLATMIIEKKLAMLEKVANFKMHRLQLQELEKTKVVEAVEPLTIEFVNSDTEEQKQRVERIDSEILNSHQAKQDA